MSLQIHAIATSVIPFIYGTLGACVYLLRSLHDFMHERTYDRRYRPEYMNRILLGTISGGIVHLLIPLGSSETAQLAGGAAVGFVAGYNTDLLFTAIERITNAILPKVPPTPVQVQATPGSQGQGTGAGSAGGTIGSGTDSKNASTTGTSGTSAGSTGTATTDGGGTGTGKTGVGTAATSGASTAETTPTANDTGPAGVGTTSTSGTGPTESADAARRSG